MLVTHCSEGAARDAFRALRGPAARARLALQVDAGCEVRGPKRHGQANFQPGEGDDVGPRVSSENICDSRVVDPGDVADLPQAEVTHRGLERERDPSRDLASGVVDDNVGPVLAEVSGPRSLGGHGPSLGVEGVKTTTPHSHVRQDSQPGLVLASSTCTVGAFLHWSDTEPHNAVNDAIDSYTPLLPHERWAPIGAFVVAAVRDADLKTAYTARNLLATLSRYVDWCYRVCGIELDLAEIFDAALIAEYADLALKDVERSTAGNYRSRLLRVAEVLNPHGVRPRMVPMAPSAGVRPYSDAEAVALWTWAYGLADPARARDAVILLAGCLGAGLTAREVCDLRGRDIEVDAGGVVLHVTGVRPRDVPAMAYVEQIFEEASSSNETDGFVFRPNRTATAKNTASNFIAQCAPSPVLLSTQRARVTWLVDHLRSGVPIQALMTAMGVNDFSAIARYLKNVPDLDPAEFRAQLRRDRRQP